MGRMLEGKWVNHDLGPDEKGRYVRRAAQFRNQVTKETSLPLKRYHLYYSSACGWSHRVLISILLKNLGNVVTKSGMKPFMGENGWELNEEEDHPLKEKGIQYLWEVYKHSEDDYTGRCSVPVLFDRETGKIVTNESMDLIKCFDNAFDEIEQVNAEKKLFPTSLVEDIDKMMAENYPAINNGVYAAGFSSSQEAYESAVKKLFDRLEEVEIILDKKRYLCGNDDITAADVCLFTTLFRFDTVYYTHFKCNLKHVYEFDNIWNYTKELYALLKETCDLDHAKEHYYTSHESVHPRRYIPLGPILNWEGNNRKEKEYN